MDAYRLQANQWLCRLEGLLARHWPEVNGLLKLSSKTLLRIMATYGGPATLAADGDAAKQLRCWGRGQLKPKKINMVLESAGTTKGLPLGNAERDWIQEIASEALQAIEQVEQCEKALRQTANQHVDMKKYVKAVGAVTLCVIWCTVGDPRKYGSAGAFLKALGLNLKELSSGKRQGELGIAKRGPGLARKWLYYWALRAVQTSELKEWYLGFQKVGKQSKGKPSSEYRKLKGVIAMMRKLCRSLWYAMRHDLEFEYEKVFPGAPLDKKRPNSCHGALNQGH